MKKTILSCFLIWLVSVIGGTLLMIGVYCLPMEPMRQNVRSADKIFAKEGVYHEVITGYMGSRLDNFTDAIMMNNVINEHGTSVIDKAMNVYRVYSSGKNPVEVLQAYLKSGESMSYGSYARYWHGYLVILKPLFLVLGYGEIRLLNIVLQLALMFGIAMSLTRRGMGKYMLPFGVTYLYLCPIALGMSLQFSGVFYVAFGGSLLMLRQYKRLCEKNRYLQFFFVLGIVTSFLDLLTYPLAALGIPLVTYYLLRDESSLKSDVAQGVKLCTGWGIGYIGMWSGKWIVGSLLTGKNVFADAMKSIGIRTSAVASEKPITYLEVLGKNAKVVLMSKWFLILLAIVVVGAVLWGIRKRAFSKNNICRILPFLVIMLFPFVWYAVTKNHSSVHFWFAYRTLGVLVFALLSGLIKGTENP